MTFLQNNTANILMCFYPPLPPSTDVFYYGSLDLCCVEIHSLLQNKNKKLITRPYSLMRYFQGLYLF